MNYKILFSKRAFKELESINEPHYTALKSSIENLKNNPKPIGSIKLKGREGYRIRVGDYRVIYTITDEILLVEIIDIGHRREIYR
jgi:mRNA interferase RelE/StbE